MGRKSKSPVKIDVSTSNDVTPVKVDGLPAFRPFIDVNNGKSGAEKENIRLYLTAPSTEDALKAKSDGFTLVGGNAAKNGIVSTAIGDYAAAKISNLFGRQLSQLVIYSYSGKTCSKSRISSVDNALRAFVSYLSEVMAQRLTDSFSIFDLKYPNWLGYRDYLEETDYAQSHIKTLFRDPLVLFSSYGPSSFEGSLKDIAGPQKNIRRKQIRNEHISVFAQFDETYSDEVMYQLLAQFIYHFNRQIDCLKNYEELNDDSMGGDWIYPGRKSKRVDVFSSNKGKNLGDISLLVDKWLSKEEYYPRILDHKLMWYKKGCRGKQTFVQRLHGIIKKSESLRGAYASYCNWEREVHQLGPGARGCVFGLYVKRHPSEDFTGSIHHLVFCLVNTVLIYTGLNKEVPLSWPSRVNGKSVLKCFDTLFVKGEGLTKEVEIVGKKSRTGSKTKEKAIRTAIVVGSPLYKMLIDYERYVKTDFSGPFFELTNEFKNTWGSPRVLRRYNVIKANGDPLSSLETKKFRKVFATSKLLQHIKGIKSAQDLAERIREDLNHSTLDVTLSNYLMRSSNAMGALDIAIATITSEKIKEAIEFQGSIEVSPGTQSAKKVFLCDCTDPRNPTHGYSIAVECTYYDLCLGCRRSVICERNLPYICLRILQYEDKRISMGNEWHAIFEDKWLIAHDALEKYIATDIAKGASLVANAWEQARFGMVSLPPIIMTKV